MMQVSTFSQRAGEQNNDLYIVNGVELHSDNPQREAIYSLSCDIQDKGKQIYGSNLFELYQWGGSSCLIFHTNTFDSVGRVVDGLATLQVEEVEPTDESLDELFHAVSSHSKTAGLSLQDGFWHEWPDVKKALQTSTKKTLLQKVTDWLQSLLQLIKRSFP
jgi:hypothetical protein